MPEQLRRTLLPFESAPANRQGGGMNTGAMQSNRDEARDALQALDPACSREEWVRDLMAAKAAGLTEGDADEWSSSASNYKGTADVGAVWRSIKPEGGITERTLFRMARDAGWKPARERDQAQRGHRRHIPATEVWNASYPAKPDHPYAVRKGAVIDHVRMVPLDSRFKVAGKSVAGWLIVPGKTLDGAMPTAQYIAPNGDKLTHPGSMGAGMFVIGEITDDAVIYITEGYGTASTAWRASGKPAVCAFGWGRVKTVASDIRRRYPGAQLVLVADVGKESSARELACEIGAQWVEMPPGWPPNADVNDLGQRDGVDAVEALLASPKSPPRPPAPFALVPIADLAHTVPDAPLFAWEGLAPMRDVMLYTAHGGGGKSTIMLMLGVASTDGKPLFGVPTRRAKVAFYSAEDGAALMRYRLHFICRAMNVDPAALEDRLFIIDATEGDPVLFAEITAAGRREGTTTATFAALREFVQTHEIGLLIIDNASDVFDANEIERAKVRGFMRALANLARECNLAVVLIAHVDKGTSRGERSGTEAYSGSTAWHNSARSRVFMSRDKDGAIVIEQQKNNLGPLHDPIRLTWPKGGVPQLDQPLGPAVQGIADRCNEKAILKLIAEFTARGEFVSTATTSRTHAGRLLAGEPTFPRLKDHELFDLLRQAERAGRLHRVTYRGTDRKPRERWDVTDDGRTFAGLPAATAATAATSDVTAPAHQPQSLAATAATSPLGGVGERARTQVAAGLA